MSVRSLGLCSHYYRMAGWPFWAETRHQPPFERKLNTRLQFVILVTDLAALPAQTQFVRTEAVIFQDDLSEARQH